MAIQPMPAAEIRIDKALVHRLIVEQHPDLASLDVVAFSSGWDNEMFRLGDDYVVRLPRRQAAAELVLHEQRWLPVLAPRLPLRIPAPIRVGGTNEEYPWAWSILPWFPGVNVAKSDTFDVDANVRILSSFLCALHQPAPDDAPINPYRGQPLRERNDVTVKRLDAVAEMVDHNRLLQIWNAAMAIPDWDGPPIWLHGDLHPANVLVEDGRITTIVDFGDIASGDPASDLSTAWMLFPLDAHGQFRAQLKLGADSQTWDRARGWALSLALAYIESSADNPMMRAIGDLTLHRVIEDANDS
jgi:aminoglycoside phosphotransferase (APT) family kinase protein